MRLEEEKSGKASEEVTIQSHLGCFHDELQSKVTHPQGMYVPLFSGRQTKYSGGQIWFAGSSSVCPPPVEGGTGGILGNQTASTKTRSHEGQVCLRKVQKSGQLVAVSRGAGEKMTVVGWDWGSLKNYLN